MQAAERIARERDFHNQRFADNSERETRTRRFYDAIAYGFEEFRSRVTAASRAPYSSTAAAMRSWRSI